MPNLKLREPIEMEGSTDTTITVLRKEPGYAHERFLGTYKGEAPIASELAGFLGYGAPFGYREARIADYVFSIIVHTD